MAVVLNILSGCEECDELLFQDLSRCMLYYDTDEAE